MQILEASFALVTPLIVGSPLARPGEISPILFRKSLRHWWQILAWSNPRFSRSVRQIREAEQAFFGSPDQNLEPFAVHLQYSPPHALAPGDALRLPGEDGVGEGIAYLGHGVMEPDERASDRLVLRVERPCILAPIQLTATLLFREQADDSMIQALKALGMMGGLGVRTRRGFGSLTLNTLQLRDSGPDRQELFRCPTSLETLSDSLRQLFSSDVRTIPPFPSVSAHTRVVLLATDSSPIRLLDRLGVRMERFRGRLRREESRQGVLDYLDPKPHYRISENRGSETRTSDHRNNDHRGSDHRNADHRGTDARPTGGSQEGTHAHRAGAMRDHPREYPRDHQDEGSESARGNGTAGWVPDHRVGTLFFHLHRLTHQQVAAVVAIFPATGPASGQGADEKRPSQRNGPRFVQQNFDELALDDFVRGHFHYSHHQAGQRYFPSATQLLPTIKQIMR